MGLPELNLTLQSLGFRVLALLIIAGVQGGIIAGTTALLGDKGPKYDGRLTLSPASHLDLAGTIGMVLFGLGWTKPMDIDPRQFRLGRGGVVVVILAGFVGLLATAALLDALVRPALTSLPHTAGLTTAAFLRVASGLTIGFALFNLIPIPPLTGGLLLKAFGVRVPSRVQAFLALALIVAVATGVVRQLLAPAQSLLVPAILGG